MVIVARDRACEFGSGTARPTGALIAIVAIVFGFIAVLMVLQHRDLDRVSGAAQREALTDPGRSQIRRPCRPAR